MSSISSTSSSAGEALVSLLRSSLTLGEAVPNGTSSSSQLSSLRTPVDIVDLSDRAQAILARAKIEKVAADKLTAQVQTARGADKSVETKSARDNASNFYETLSGNAPSKFTSADSNTNWGATSGGFLELSNYLQKLVNDHRRPDGTVSSFVETVNDVFNTPPSTPQEISDWRKNEEARAAQVAEGEPDPALKAQAQAYLEAVRNGQVTVVSAKDIPDLDFHNTAILQGGEGGASMNGTFTYNHNASVFKDPSKTYLVSSGGTLVVWSHAPVQV